MNSFNKTTQTTSFPLLHFFFLLLLSISTITQFPLASHGCLEQERRALLNIKSSLVDPVHRLFSWQDSVQHQNCCDWRGIRCTRESFLVISIDLRNTEYENYQGSELSDTALHGMLPNHSFLHLPTWNIGQFSYLTELAHLDLFGSGISGLISTQFSNLSSLEYLDLSCMSLFGRGTSSVGYCSELSSIKWVRGLVNLQVLRLTGIDLSEATSSKENFGHHISYLWNLRDLDLSCCNISGPVFPIHQFHNLSHLFSLKMMRPSTVIVSYCELSPKPIFVLVDVPACEFEGSIPYLPQLKELDVTDNTNLDPDQLTRMFERPWPNLRILQISGTPLHKPIPSSISSAPLLASLSASGCSIQGSLPSSIYNLSGLQYLDLSTNIIKSSIHSSISNLKYLNFLDLSENNIFGPIPKSICEILSLRQLALGSNQITGSIPRCITKLQNLVVFDVSKNSIRGKVLLISLINELNLTTLRLRFIPAFICNFTHIDEVDLSYNKLTGAIPSCISKLKNLHSLDLSNNRLRGPLPLLPPSVESLDLSNNKLNGNISFETGKILSRLGGNSGIVLYGNELSGSIPSSICSQETGGPEYLDLSNNKLSGTIPTSIGYCTLLSYLILGNNNLTGNVPNELEQAEYLEYLQLSDNNLNGTFPKVIKRLTYLRGLYLGNNNFEGIIPTGLGSIELLGFLSLRSNKFNGSIPKDIFQLDTLQVLDLSGNNLSGSIPKEIGNLRRLTSRIINSSRYIFNLPHPNVMQFQLVIKGTLIPSVQEDSYISGIDLSSNILDGNIPEEIGLLQALVMLNLSHNHFLNNIPASIGNMSSLESLDLSSNNLSGPIPQALASIDSLGFLNLSHNNLSGRIPRENHFDTLGLEGSAFAGNDLLCGFPIEKDCEGDPRTSAGDANPSSLVDEDDHEEAKERLLLYAIIALGFAFGFWGLFFVLYSRKHQWWFRYWKIVDSLAVRIVQGCIHKN
ncbi:hypothetical protein MKW92_017813 [Papaver armeniacum]|nr:hypothetical protein MKW92_017813 [Papaver armeniacum]